VDDAGQLFVAAMTVGQLFVAPMTIGQPFVAPMTVGQLFVAPMTVGQLYVAPMSVSLLPEVAELFVVDHLVRQNEYWERYTGLSKTYFC
jgi:hypothetical protein